MDILVNTNRKTGSYGAIRNPSSFLCTDSYLYNIRISTDYETRNIPIEFKIVNGTIQLTNKASVEVPIISINTFPVSFSFFLY
jgi:hypothetical protein